MFQIFRHNGHHILTIICTLLSLEASGATETEVDSISRVAVVYPVCKSQIDPDSLLQNVVEEVNTMMSKPLTIPEEVVIIGSSSPEGPARLNDRLAHDRAISLRDYMLQHTTLPDSLIHLEFRPEDWENVLENLNKGDYPYTAQVTALLEKYPDRVSRKMEAQRLEGGHIWRNLLRDIFPINRNARIRIVAHHPAAYDEIHLLPPATSAHPLEQLPLPLTTQGEDTAEDRFFAIKNNLIFDAAIIANLGFELELWRHWSLDLPIFYSPYDITSTRKVRVLAAQPEIRYWLEKAGTHHFVALNTSVVGFNIALNDRYRYQDPEYAAWGVGISYGYATHLDRNRRWGLEFNIGLGFLHYHYDAFRNCNNGTLLYTGSSTYYGVSRAGITISYQWHRQRKNRGFLQW